MSTQLTFGKDAREKMKKGIDIVADAVKVTLGPKGRHVTIQRQNGQPPFITKDGVTVAANIRNLSDPWEDSGAQLIKSVAWKTAAETGDGTTTSTLLTQFLITQGMKLVDEGANPVDLKRGMDKAVKDAVKNINRQAQKITNDSPEVLSIATISANNDAEIGQHIANAVKMVGEDGLINKAESKTSETYVDLVSGLLLDKGWIDQKFVTDKKRDEAVLENPLILMYHKKISVFADIEGVISICMKAQGGPRSLLIIAEDVNSDALATVIVNTVRGIIKVCIVKNPGYGASSINLLEDVAVMVGGTVVNEEHGLKLDKVGVAVLGSAEKIIASRTATTIIGGRGSKEKITERTDALRSQLEMGNHSPYEKTQLETRLAKLTNGMAIIYVGAPGDTEAKEKMDRVDDALCATKAALQEGIVPGGGMAYIRAEDGGADIDNEDEVKGYNLLMSSLSHPLRQIAKNAGLNPDEIINKVSKDASIGFNAKTETYEDLMITGVIDPTKVVRVALENANSVAGMFLTTECSMVEVPEK